MKPNEIIKALECCSCETIMYCEEQCPFYERCMKDEQLAKYALDLINRQAEAIKQKDTEISILIRKKEALRDEIEELQSVIASIYEQLRELEFLAELLEGEENV